MPTFITWNLFAQDTQVRRERQRGCEQVKETLILYYHGALPERFVPVSARRWPMTAHHLVTAH